MRTLTVTDDGVRVDQGWSAKIPSVFKPNVKAEDLAAHEKVPETIQALLQWACVRKVFSADPRRQFNYVSLANATSAVQIHFQGYVHGCNLRTLGDWNE